jgi:hypothetical protein
VVVIAGEDCIRTEGWCEVSVMFYRLEWTDRRGGFHSEPGSFERLTKKLETLRRPADLWLVDEQGVKIETIGGCEYAPDIADDKRIKWNWWYDRTAGQPQVSCHAKIEAKMGL